MQSFNRCLRRPLLDSIIACLVSIVSVSFFLDHVLVTTTATPFFGSTITVNSTSDAENSADGLCTLREAITAANTNTASGVTAGECVAGSDPAPDIISLTGVTGTITLGSALPSITSEMNFNGPGQTQLTISGNSSTFRVFHVRFSSGTVNFSGLTITNGRANGDVGGGIYNDGNTNVNVTDSTISFNQAVLGGGIANSGTGTFTITNSTINNNSASTAGGCVNLGTLNIINSTLNNNAAGLSTPGSGNGGAINSSGPTLNVINSTFQNNTANGGGGGIFAGGSGAVINVTNSTITQNFAVATGGGGINNNFAGTINIRNTILAENGSSFGPDGVGTFNSLGHNLVGNFFGTNFTLGTNNPNGDLVGATFAPVFAILGPLQNNGGATQTRALLPGSAAIDAGDNCVVLASGSGGCLSTPLTTDQRGVARQVNSTVDIGAYESREFTLSPSSGTPQSTPVRTMFAPLVVTVGSVGGDPVAGGFVDFTAPETTTAPTAIFATTTNGIQISINSSGQASTAPTANGIAGGPYNATATIKRSAASATFSLTNTQAATNTAVTSSSNPSDLTQSVTFTATVTSTGPLTGTVQFKIDGSNSGSPVTLSGGVATLTTSALTVSTHTVTADYSGDANFLASSGTLSGGQVVRPPPTLSINDVSITEGDSSTKVLIFTVTKSASSNITVTADFATANDTATAPSDYVARIGTISFSPGQTLQSIFVTINGDVNFEPNETFTVTLSNPVNATLNDSQGTGTILNDDAEGGFIRFNQPSAIVNENDGKVTVTVIRLNDTSRAATVDYATSESGAPVTCNGVNGIASHRCDFTTARGTLRFAAGETSKTVDVLVNRDSFAEGLENFSISLTNPTGGAVVVAPSLAVVAITDGLTGPPPNLIDDATVFVRQHYHDFLNREPDSAGLAFWANEITSCGSDAACIEIKRINVSGAFFLAIEFQETGYFVERAYKAAYGDASAMSNLNGPHQIAVPIVRLNEFLPDTQSIGKGIIVGQPGWEALLQLNRQQFVAEFVQRARFVTEYPTSMSPAQFVDELFLNAGVVPTTEQRNAAINEFGSATTTTDVAARGRALQRIVENATFVQQESNRAFVLMQYFGYMRRNPDDPQDTDYTGYDFWLTKLNQFNGNFVTAEMVKAFISSNEYRQRFGP